MTGHLLAIDAGTGSGRAVVFAGDGTQLGAAQEEWRHIEEPNVPGSMSFDWERNWDLICRCIRGALADAGIQGSDIAAVSATSMREGIVLFDAAGQELWACANVDSRAAEQVAAIKRRSPDLEEKFYRQSGQTFALGTLPRLQWVAEHQPRIFERTAHVCMISDWVLARLSGEIAVEPSNAGTSGLLSLRKRSWADALTAETGLDRSAFPPVVESGTKIGQVTARAADDTGLAAGTPVIAGGGDVQLGTVGLGVVGVGDTAILGGTFWQQVVNVPLDKIDDTMRVRINPHAVVGLNQAECISFFVGTTMRWFRDAFCAEEKRRASVEGRDAYEILEEMAADVPPGANGIVPVFSDAMEFGAWYHAAPSLLNLSLDPAVCNKASIFRALQENAAIVAAENMRRVTEFSGVEADRPVVFAGGASKGRLWSQIVADVLGREVKIPVVKEATALGCAAAAAVGVGLYGSLAEAGRSMVRWERSVEPSSRASEIYEAARARWGMIYPTQKALVDQGLTTAMWKAPGL